MKGSLAITSRVQSTKPKITGSNPVGRVSPEPEIPLNLAGFRRLAIRPPNLRFRSDALRLAGPPRNHRALLRLGAGLRAASRPRLSRGAGGLNCLCFAWEAQLLGDTRCGWRRTRWRRCSGFERRSRPPLRQRGEPWMNECSSGFRRLYARSVWSRLPPSSRLRRAFTARSSRRFADAFNRRDWDVLMPFLHPEFSFEGAVGPMGAYFPDLSQVHYGAEEYRHMFETLAEGWEDLTIQSEEVVDLGDRLFRRQPPHGPWQDQRGPPRHTSVSGREPAERDDRAPEGLRRARQGPRGRRSLGVALRTQSDSSTARPARTRGPHQGGRLGDSASATAGPGAELLDQHLVGRELVPAKTLRALARQPPVTGIHPRRVEDRAAAAAARDHPWLPICRRRRYSARS